MHFIFELAFVIDSNQFLDISLSHTYTSKKENSQAIFKLNLFYLNCLDLLLFPIDPYSTLLSSMVGLE